MYTAVLFPSLTIYIFCLAVAKLHDVIHTDMTVYRMLSSYAFNIHDIISIVRMAQQHGIPQFNTAYIYGFPERNHN